MLQVESRNGIGSCPSAEVLSAFHSGKLSDVELDELLEHLDCCAKCHSSLSTIEPKEPSDSSFNSQEISCRGDAISDPPGQRFGSYILMERVGEGSIGVVYKAWESSLRRHVAIKRLKPEICRKTEMMDLLQGEGLAVARISHPNIVPIFHSGQVSGQPFLCMEYMEGGSLAKKIGGKPLEPAFAADLVRKLAMAVEESHRLGILHRDLKPSNVLLAGNGTPKIGDFGLAKLADETGKFPQESGICGSPSYMAPEQTVNEGRDLGPASDVYSLGAILYEALTGRPPFFGPDKAEVLQRVRQAEPLAPSRLNPEVARDLEAICLKCLAKHSEQRYLSAGELAEKLHDWLGQGDGSGQVTQATRSGSRGRWAQPLLPIAVGSLLILGLVFSAMLYVPQKTSTRVSSELDPEAPIKEIESRLANGEAVTLIGEKGAPTSWRWRLGSRASYVTASEDGGYFTIDTATTAVVEIARDPQVERYRLRAELRHETGKAFAEIGLACGMCDYPLRDTSLHFFAGAWFDDTHDERANRRPAGAPAAKRNRVSMGARFYAEDGMDAAHDWRIGALAPELFEATGPNAEPIWRQLTLDVSPSGIKATWGSEQLVGEFTSDQIREQAKICRDNSANIRRPKDKPLLQAIEPVFHPRGSVGLYVQRGKASFRNVVIEPMSDK